MAARRVVIFGWAESVHIRRWAQGLARRGYDLQVVSLGGTTLPDIPTVIFPRRNRLSYLSTSGRAVRAARGHEPHLVHAHSAAAFGIWALRVRRRPLVVSVWGSDVVQFPSNAIKRAYLRRVLRAADRVTATSRFLADRTLELCPDIEDRLQVIPFGVEIPEQTPDPPGSAPRLCFIKAHKAVYAPEALLKSMVAVAQALPDVRLAIAGSGPLTPRLMRLTADLGLDRHVVFTGTLSGDQVYRLLAQSHIMVMPSLREAFGVAALEAAACARPVIACDVGGVREVVRHGQTGVLVPPGDSRALAEAIIALAADPQRCRELGLAARRFVAENYALDLVLDRMTALYERLINAQA